MGDGERTRSFLDRGWRCRRLNGTGERRTYCNARYRYHPTSSSSPEVILRSFPIRPRQTAVLNEDTLPSLCHCTLRPHFLRHFDLSLCRDCRGGELRAEESFELEGEVESHVSQLSTSSSVRRREGREKGTHHGTVRFGHFERLLDDFIVLVCSVHLSSERLGVNLDLLARPSHEPYHPSSVQNMRGIGRGD